mmetsp:Transcript_17410/g.16605  ORF Transcript_17410/g.16605 Transcript_17410/m.16605 type:complete len:133 (-) Transcript_17410:500-898(-)
MESKDKQGDLFNEIEVFKDSLKEVVEKEQPEGKEPMSEKATKLYLALKALTALRMTKDDNQPAEIIPGLFLGSIGAAFKKESLVQHGITHILTCADKLKPRFPEEFEYLCLPVLDSPTNNIVMFFGDACNFI